MTESGADRADHVAAIVDLVAANERSNQTMLALLQEVRRESEVRGHRVAAVERANKQNRVLTYLLAVGLAIMLVLGAVTLYNVSLTNSQTDNIASINRTLLDCVNSTGECGRVNTAQEAKILDTVKQYELTGFYCIRTNPGTADPKGTAFLACMDRLYPGGPKLNKR